MTSKFSLSWAAFFGALAVILGAMGAHALKARLDADSLNSFETAVRYQAWHALALLALGTSKAALPNLKAVAWCWIIGVLLFSGSIYLLSTSELSGLELSFLGPVTPIGGLFMIVGWVLLFISAIRSSESSR